MKYKISLRIIILILILILPKNTANANGKITGVVVNNDDKKPLISATVALHRTADSTIVSGAITDRRGRFTITAADGNYYIAIKYIGFENHFISNINLASNKTQTLDTIRLKPTDILQSNIIVEAEKELVEIGIDSRKYNVTKDMTIGETNILDVLRKIPSLEVDMDDNIKMNGRSPKILIDGRESPLSDKEMLKVLSADLVESVELITNPSAKYESEGVTGIIDIRLNKGIDIGFNAMINAGFGRDFEFKYSENANAGINTNVKIGKLNLFARFSHYNSASSSEWDGLRKTWLDADIYNPDTTYNSRFGDSKNKYNNNYGSIGVDYEFTKNDAVTFNMDFSAGGNKNNSYGNYNITNSANILMQDYENLSNNKSNRFNGGASLYYKKSFEEKGHNLYFDASYRNNNSEGDNANNFYYYPTELVDTLYKRLFNNNTENPNSSFTFKIDYEKTLELFGNLGCGIRTNNRSLSSIITNNQYNYSIDDYEINPLLSDDFEYNSGVYSAYFTLGKSWTGFSYRAGLRAEYTDWEFISNAADTTFGQDYLSLMPSINLSYKIGIKHTFGVGYSRRLSRPWHSQFNPYIRIFDSTSVSSGNPDLQPSYYNSYNVNYMLFMPKTTISTYFNYNNTDNSTETFNTITEWGGILSYPINAGISESIGGSLSIQQKIFEWWSLNIYGSLYNSKIAAPSLGIDTREQTSWSVNANTSLRILKKLRISSYFYYSPSSITLQGKGAGWYQLSAGANYTMFEDKLSMRLNFGGLIALERPENITYGDYFYSISHYNRQRRTFSLGFSYRINDYKESRRNIDEDGGNQGGGSSGGVI